jgi:hypothetical protein
MGLPADKRAAPGGETVYWYPQLQYGYASYAARISPEGRLVALEQRLTEANVAKVVKGASAAEVRDLLGPPYQPTVFQPLAREVWTYPLRQSGYVYPRWFIVHLSLDDRTVRETYLMDDPTWAQPDSARRHR